MKQVICVNTKSAVAFFSCTNSQNFFHSFKMRFHTLTRFSPTLIPYQNLRYMSSSNRKQSPSDIFDRIAKRRQRDIAASKSDYETYSYLREEFGYRLSDRVFDIKRTFPVLVDMACGQGHVSKHFSEDIVQTVFLCDSSQHNLEKALPPEGNVNIVKVVTDEEDLPLKSNTADIIVSNFNLHWINDLTRCFSRVMEVLVPDGVFIGSMLGGQSLYQLRCSLQLAENERKGGLGLHVSPLIQANDLGRLLQRTGFNMITVDTDEIVISYPTMFELMNDLQDMGESNCLWNRSLHLDRSIILAGASIYKEMYGNEDGTIPTSFQVYNFIGWKPHESQPKPLERGSGNFSFKDIHNLDNVLKK